MESASAPPECGNTLYTSCYCEENIYWLIDHFLGPSETHQEWDVFAVFISNETKTVVLCNQRAAPSTSKDAAVIWDYHVVLALREYGESQSYWKDTWIYDLDTNLPIPCRWNAYVDQTFPLGINMPSQYQSRFRVVPGDVYLNNFASDRSHMLQVSPTSTHEPEVRYLAKPPPYPVICGPEAKKRGIKHNLMTQFVPMIGDEQGFGSVMDFDAFTTWCSLSG